MCLYSFNRYSVFERETLVADDGPIQIFLTIDVKMNLFWDDA